MTSFSIAFVTLTPVVGATNSHNSRLRTKTFPIIPVHIAARSHGKPSIPAMVINTSTEPTTPNLDSASSMSPPVPSLSPCDFSNPSFIDAVSGEWFGYEVTFSAKTGDALEIEERFVPDEYRNWGVSIKGFDCVTSTTVFDSNLLVKRTRALPTVGCEADAVIPDVSTTTLHSHSPNALTTTSAYNVSFEDGSYTSGPAVLSDEPWQKWTCALMDPQGSKTRVRLLFGRVDKATGSVSVFLEKWESPYCAGEVLPGCGGPNSSFAEQERTLPQQLAGIWGVERTSFNAADGWNPSSSSERLERTSSSVSSLFMMPKGLSVGIAQKNGATSTVVEAGWLISDTSRIVVTREYAATGELTCVSRAVETKTA